MRNLILKMVSKLTLFTQLAIFLLINLHLGETVRGPLLWSDEFDSLNSINNNWNQEV